MRKNKLKSSYTSVRSQPIRSSYRSNTLHKYSPKARLIRLIITLGVIFVAFITVLAFVVFPKINVRTDTGFLAETLPTPDPTPNPYSALVIPADITYIEDIPSWVKTDVYGQPVELKRSAADTAIRCGRWWTAKT